MKFGIYLPIIAGLALAGCKPPAPPTKEERTREFVRCFREEMNPSDEQIKNLQQILGDDSTIQKVNAEFKRAADQLEAQLENPKTTDSDLLPLYGRVGELKSRLAEDHFRRMLKLRSVLSDEQKSRFLACKRKLGPPQLPHE